MERERKRERERERGAAIYRKEARCLGSYIQTQSSDLRLQVSTNLFCSLKCLVFRNVMFWIWFKLCRQQVVRCMYFYLFYFILKLVCLIMFQFSSIYKTFICDVINFVVNFIEPAPVKSEVRLQITMDKKLQLGCSKSDLHYLDYRSSCSHCIYKFSAKLIHI